MADLDNYDDETEEESSPSSSVDTAADMASPTADSAALASTSVPSKINPSIVSYLAGKQQQLQDAQDKAGTNQLIASLARAGGTLASSTYGNKDPLDTAGYDALDKSAQLPVQNLMAQQKNSSQALQDRMEAEKASAQEASNDPNSEASKRFRATVQATVPKIAAALGDNFQYITAADQPYILNLGKLKETTDARNLATQTHSQDLKYKYDWLSQERANKENDREDAADAKQEAKSTADQEKSYTQLRKDLETFRGNRAVTQAAMDAYSADKALAIVKDKDPNTLTTQDLNLLANEMGKIASGGVPGEHGVQALLPSNLQTKYAELKNFLSSNPTNANAGAYVQKNMQYLKGMVDEANQRVNSYRSNILKGYNGRVAPEKYKEAQQDYQLGDFSPQSTPPPTSQFTPDVVSYASQHGITPQQAAAIKAKRTGGQ